MLGLGKLDSEHVDRPERLFRDIERGRYVGTAVYVIACTLWLNSLDQRRSAKLRLCLSRYGP